MNFTSISLSEFCIFKMAVPQGVITRVFQGNYTGKSELTKCLNQQELDYFSLDRKYTSDMRRGEPAEEDTDGGHH